MASPPAIPPLVLAALTLADAMGFHRSCSIETGRLLRTLAAQVQTGVVGEVGAGCGIGSAWLLSGLRADVSFVTVEIEATRAAAVRELLSDVPNATVIEGDWTGVLKHGPFALLFVDAVPAKQGDPEILRAAMRPGGLVVLDDFTPGAQSEADAWLSPDPIRDAWLTHPRFVATEVMVSASEVVILAARATAHCFAGPHYESPPGGKGVT